MKRLLTIVASFCALPFAATQALATLMTVTVSGTTTSNIHDGTDYFGFGSGIPGGTPYSMSFTFDPDIAGRVTGQGPSGQVGGRSIWRSVMTQCCEPATSPPYFASPGPSRITGFTLALSGKDLNVNTDVFPQHQSLQDYTAGATNIVRPGCTPGCASSQFEASMRYEGTGLSGNTMATSFRANFLDLGSNPGDVQPVPLDFLFTSELYFRLQGTANFALLLLNPDGSVAVDISNGTSGGFGISRFYQAEADIPLPAALPLLPVGLSTLVGIGKARRRTVKTHVRHLGCPAPLFILPLAGKVAWRSACEAAADGGQCSCSATAPSGASRHLPGKRGG